MFYDLEMQQDTATHVVNYVNAQDFDGNEFTFENIGSFCEFVFNDEHEGYTFIAHNAKSFDAQFILKYCIDNAYNDDNGFITILYIQRYEDHVHGCKRIQYTVH